MRPFVPMTLLRTTDAVHIDSRLTVPALVDFGSTINVLPYDIGIQLGFVWNEHPTHQPLVGMLRGRPALGVVVFVKMEQLALVRLIFAWSQIPSREFPLILGQTNFFDEFCVHCLRERNLAIPQKSHI